MRQTVNAAAAPITRPVFHLVQERPFGGPPPPPMQTWGEDVQNTQDLFHVHVSRLRASEIARLPVPSPSARVA